MVLKKGFLALESGRVFEGWSFGSDGESYGEIVFNTSITGYQEILTDPSYCGQIITMTHPHIGNYGFNQEDPESSKIHAAGFVVKEASAVVSNWRATGSLSEYLSEYGVVAIEGIDTRALTRHIRQAGAMKAVISTTESNHKKLVQKAKNSLGLDGRDLVKDVTCRDKYIFNPGVKAKYKVAVLDCGCKTNILRDLAARGCEVTVFPAFAKAKEILETKPDGIMLTNGPGDPAAVTYVIDTVKQLLSHISSGHKIPLFGICLGHQMLGLAFGGETYKLKFGHRGANHPVKDIITGKIEITSQNHGFCVKPESLPKSHIEITHCNLYDGTTEGFRHKELPVFCVQYHPESSPGPHDSSYLFDRFIAMMSNK
jgi:carbamoyl-phosphate synthase small subunit